MSDPWQQNADAVTADTVWNNGERQNATRIEDIRADHRGRYEFAAKWLVNQSRTHVDILDAACGTGYGSRILADAVPGARVHGVDISHAAIAWGRKHFEPFPRPTTGAGMILFQADCLSLPFDAESFHVVVSFETLEHLNARAFMCEVHRVLKPGGIFFGSTPNQDVLPWSPDFTHHLRHYTPDELQELLTTAGFEVMSKHSNAGRWEPTIIDGWNGLFNVAVARKL